MAEKKDASPAGATTVERKSDRELVVTRTFNAPAHIVFEAWSKPELFKRWWVPKSAGLSLLSCDMDVRTEGAYRLVFRHPTSDQPMAFFGTTLVTLHELYPTKAALDEALAGSAEALPEQFAQLDELLAGRSA
jgi:hypothetical protein